MGIIRDIRQEKGLSTTDLARRLGITQSSVVRLEQSEDMKSISLLSLERAAEALGFAVKLEFKPLDQESIIRPIAPRKRIRIKSKGTPSAIAEQLKADTTLSSPLSVEKRIEQVCALSDLAKELRYV